MSIFNKIPMPKLRHSKHNLSFNNKFTANMGYIYPFAVYDCVPGDTFKLNTGFRVRTQPLIAPIMHEVNGFVRWFFVPYRLLWDNWQEFITGGVDGAASPVYPVLTPDRNSPIFLNDEWETNNGEFVRLVSNGSLADYLGFPTYVQSDQHTIILDNQPQIKNVYSYDLMPFKAYQFIYNEYFRDQNLSEEVPLYTNLDGEIGGQGRDVWNLFALRAHAWEKDMFTSALPWAQRGQDSTISFDNDTLPIVWNDNVNGLALQRIRNIDGQFVTQDSGVFYNLETRRDSPADPTSYLSTDTGSSHPYRNIDLNNTHVVDASGVSLFSIQALRLAAAVQRFFENNARSGSRSVEQIAARFGVRVPDYRLDRPEYLGGGMFPLRFSEVLQTSSTDSTSPQGNMAGRGFGTGSSRPVKYFCQEHGILMGLFYCQPRSAYSQGLPRMYSRRDKFDFFTPEFQHLGEQEILNKEIYMSANANVDDGTFGYTPRYAEYKFKANEIHGDFKTNMSFWHLSREFDMLPALNESFVCAFPRKDVFAVQSDQYDSLLVETFVECYARRPMSMFGTPSSII